MWFHDIARGHTNKNARADTPQNQITFEMLTGSRQFDTIEAQIQCPHLLYKQLKRWPLKLGIERLLKESPQVATLKYYKDLTKVMLIF